jgi:acyl CoA:acetate/3-ketoacid CoA transferase
LALIEVAPGINLAKHVLSQMDFVPDVSHIPMASKPSSYM